MINQYRGEFHLAKMCKVLGVSRSGYYLWETRPECVSQAVNKRILDEIIHVYESSRRTYGSRKVAKALKRKGVKCSRNRIARIMKDNDMYSVRTRKYKATTNSKHNLPVAENLLADLKNSIETPHQAIVADITYIPTDEGWLYLASVMDFHSKHLEGWAMGDRMTKELVMHALEMAVTRSGQLTGALHHSDRGSQYASLDYQQVLTDNKMICSMSRKGNCYDNAWAESFNATIKMECVYLNHFNTRQEARQCLFEYIEVFYNRYRLHSAIGYLPPEEYEKGRVA